MIKLLKFEWNRGICSRGFKLSFMISILLILLNFRASYFLYQSGGMTKYPEIFLEGFIGLNYQFVYMGLFHALLPILATLPFGGSFYSDKESGYIKNIRLNSSRRQYYTAKYIITFVLGVVVITIPMLISLMLSMTHLPILLPEPFAYQDHSELSIFTEIYYTHPLFYGIAISVLEGLFGGLFAVEALCISNYVNNTFTVLLIPFMVYILMDSICAILHLENFCYFCLTDPLMLCGSYVIPMLCLGIIVTSYWFICHESRKEVL